MVKLIYALIMAVIIWPFLLIAVLKGIPLLLRFINGLGIRFEKKVQEHKDLTEKFDPLGQPYPLKERGLCDNWSEAIEDVFFLTSGRRLCKKCYDAEILAAKEQP